MIITVNGAHREVPEGVTVADVVTAEHPEAMNQRGVAVAVDRAVVPRTQWSITTVTAGARIEFVTAVQGG